MMHANRTYRTASSLPIYNYLFAQTPICPRPPQYGLVDHTEELAYVFGTRSSYLSHGMEKDCGWPDDEKDFAYQVYSSLSLWCCSSCDLGIDLFVVSINQSNRYRINGPCLHDQQIHQ
jgi:hypothetical protein